MLASIDSEDSSSSEYPKAAVTDLAAAQSLERPLRATAANESRTVWVTDVILNFTFCTSQSFWGSTSQSWGELH